MFYDMTHYFNRKIIDKRPKIKSKCCRGGGLNLCRLITSVFPELKYLKSYHLNPSAAARHIEWRVIKKPFKTVRRRQFYTNWIDRFSDITKTIPS